jgi:hypothetical protein
MRLRISCESALQIRWYLGFWPISSRLDRQRYSVACLCSSGFAHSFVGPEPVASPAVWFERGLKAETIDGSSTIVMPRDGSFALALSGSLRRLHEPISNILDLKRIADIFLVPCSFATAGAPGL